MGGLFAGMVSVGAELLVMLLLLLLASLDLAPQGGTQAKGKTESQQLSDAHPDPNPHEHVGVVLDPLHQSTVATLREEVDQLGTFYRRAVDILVSVNLIIILAKLFIQLLQTGTQQ